MNRFQKYTVLAQEVQDNPDLIKKHIAAKIPHYLQSELDEVLLMLDSFNTDEGIPCQDNAVLQRLKNDEMHLKTALSVYQ